jgi:hypothetical protein
MNIHPEVAPGLYGTGITWGTAVLSFCASAIPVLQALLLIVSIVAGVLTSVWTWKKIVGKK